MSAFYKLIIITLSFIFLSTSWVSALSCPRVERPENNPKITGPMISSGNIMKALDGHTVELSGYLNYILENVPERPMSSCKMQFMHPIFVDKNHEFILLRDLSNFEPEITNCVEPPVPFSKNDDAVYVKRPINWEHQIKQCEVTLIGKFAYKENPLFEIADINYTWFPTPFPMNNAHLLYLDVKDIKILKKTLLRKDLND